FVIYVIFIYFSFLSDFWFPSSTLFPYTTLFRSHFIKGFLHVIQTFFLQIPESIFLIVLISMITIIFIYDFPHFIQVLEAKFPIKDRKSTRLNSSHVSISYAVFCLKKKTTK